MLIALTLILKSSLASWRRASNQETKHILCYRRYSFYPSIDESNALSVHTHTLTTGCLILCWVIADIGWGKSVIVLEQGG